MKKITYALMVVALTSCKKDYRACLKGDTCTVKNNIFNKGVYQPVCPVHADSVYIDQTYMIPYVKATDQNKTVWYIPQEDLYAVNP
jgi:hypothetical protein